MITRVTPGVTDPPHLHLAAVAMGYTVLSGTLTFEEAAASLGRAAVDDGAFDRMALPQFQALCGRLEHSIVQSTLRIERKAADGIRAAIRRPIADRHPKSSILLIATTENMLASYRRPGGFRLPERAVEEICRQEVRKALEGARARR
jgi:hypothetical protein